jgi:four helix bundle protein
MGARHVEDLVAYQWAHELKLEVYRLFDESATAAGDLRYRDQLFAAASGAESNIAEGFARRRPREFAQFLRYALASLSETKTRLVDGVDRRHFTRADIGQALSFGVRWTDATRALHASQVRFIEGDPRGATGRRRPRL